MTDTTAKAQSLDWLRLLNEQLAESQRAEDRAYNEYQACFTAVVDIEDPLLIELMTLGVPEPLAAAKARLASAKESAVMIEARQRWQAAKIEAGILHRKWQIVFNDWLCADKAAR